MLVVLLTFRTMGAVNWKLILKDGNVIECTGAPLIIGGVYTFRQADGKTGSLTADQIDQEKTNQANKVDRTVWREIGGATTKQAPRAAAPPNMDFQTQVLQSRSPVLVEFWASWCGYCRKFEPTVRAIGGEYAGRLRVVRVDIDQSPEIARQYGVDGTPTLLLFKEGRVAGSIVGAAPKDQVVRMLDSSL